MILLLQPADVKHGFKSKRIFSVDKSKSRLTDGPYVVSKSTGHIFPVYKMFSDTHHAFVSAIVQGMSPGPNLFELKVRVPLYT